MKEIYSSGLFTVTKGRDGEYTFHANRIPVLRAPAKAAVELAEAIQKEEAQNTPMPATENEYIYTGDGAPIQTTYDYE